MKAMGYAQQVIESISGNTSNGVLSWTGKKSGSDSGSGSLNIKEIKVNNAGHADSAGSATKATQDGNGQNISSTYAKKSDGLITDLSISNGTYSFYHYNSAGEKEYTGGLVDRGIYVHHLKISKSGNGRVFVTIINRSSSHISLQQLASYTSNGSRIMCSGYMGQKVVSAIRYAGMNSVYAIEAWAGKQDTYIIDSSYTISDTTRSI